MLHEDDASVLVHPFRELSLSLTERQPCPTGADATKVEAQLGREETSEGQPQRRTEGIAPEMGPKAGSECLGG